ncbi:hypothetical protein DFS34DRAFT_508 [Phlyctochytrium arcticum]|nr:hypothetical protein DFS34DRAFT_508 [Phlyctochytrium arcticum]
MSCSKLAILKQTAMAFHAIVTLGLYKSTGKNLTAYAKDVFNINKSQVYRLVDCAKVLHLLRNFGQQPCKERVCVRILQLARNPADVRTLWAAILDHVNQDHDAASVRIAEGIWVILLDGGEVTGNPDTGNEALTHPDVGDLQGLEAMIHAGLAGQQLAPPAPPQCQRKRRSGTKSFFRLWKEVGVAFFF